MEDARGNALKVGDRIRVNMTDASRGAHLWMDFGYVRGFARTRVIISQDSASGEFRVGGETMVITEAVDGRVLRSWDDVWAERK